MPLRSPYKVAEIFHENASTPIQRARHAYGSKSVILKTFKGFLKSPHPLFPPYISTKFQHYGTGLRFAVSIPRKDLNA